MQSNDRCAWNDNVYWEIGILAGTGVRTSEYTVITQVNGKLWTMYPGPVI